MRIKTLISLLCGLLLGSAAQAQPPGSSIIFEHHSDAVTSVAFHPTEEFLVSGSADGLIIYWHLNSYQPIEIANPESGGIRSVAFSADGNLLASGTQLGGALLWNAETGERITDFKKDSEAIVGVAFSPDGNELLALSQSGVITVWDISTGEVIREISDDGKIISFAVSPSDGVIATGSISGRIIMRDISTGREVAVLRGHGDQVNALAFNADGTLLASGSNDFTIRIWDYSTKEIVTTLASQHSEFFTSVSFHPDGGILVSGSDENLVTLWNIAEEKELSIMKDEWGHVFSVAFSPDGTQLASAFSDFTVRLFGVDDFFALSGNREGAQGIYPTLYSSARFLNRRDGVLNHDLTPSVVSEIIRIASNNASSALTSLATALDSFMWTDRTSDFKAEENSNFKSAQIARDQVSRNLLVISALVEFSENTTWDDAAKVAIATQGAETWNKTAQSILAFYPELGDDMVPAHLNDEGKTWNRRMRFIARRQALTAEELLRAAPAPEQVSRLDSELRAEVLRTKVDLLGLESNFNAILELCRDVAQSDPQFADELATAAVVSLGLVPEYAGRSERGRNASQSLGSSDFRSFIQGLSEMEGLTGYRSAVPETLVLFFQIRRPFEVHDLQTALSPLSEYTGEELQLFTERMLKLLSDVQRPTGGASDIGTAFNTRDNAARISEEYEALDNIIMEWQDGRETWHGDLLRAQVQFAWGRHQLDFVESGLEAAQTNDRVASITDAEGYRKHVGNWRDLMRDAGEKLLDESSLNENADLKQISVFLNQWFNRTLQVKAEPAYRFAQTGDMLEEIRIWLARLPQEISGTLLTKFAELQLERLDPPPGSGDSTAGPDAGEVPHNQKYDFVKSVASLAPETPVGRMFAEIQREYESFGENIEFHVIPDGELYRAEGWAMGEMPTYPVNAGEFGIWFTLVHTDDASQSSGGFRRYTENAPAVSPDEKATLSDTERTQYAEDFKRYLEAQLAGVFDVVLVEPNTKPDRRRQFLRDDGVWYETPLYYAVLRPRATAAANELPGFQLDLDFPHDLGRIILPFYSQRIALKFEDGKDSHIRDATVRQDLDITNRDRGELSLIVTSDSLGLPPQPHEHTRHLPPSGFEIDPARTDSTIEVLGFPGGSNSVRVRRTTTYWLEGMGSGFSTLFKFPEYPTTHGNGDSETAFEVRNFLKVAGQIQERPIPKGEVAVHGMPWRWEFALSWLSRVAFLGSMVLAGLVCALGTIRLVRKKQASKKNAFPFSRPLRNTPLAGANFLRRLAAAEAISFPDSQVAELRQDIEELENQALLNSDSAVANATLLIDKWFQRAQSCFDPGN